VKTFKPLPLPHLRSPSIGEIESASYETSKVRVLEYEINVGGE